MPFDWLADPDRYRHPRLSWLIALGFDLALRALYRREEVVAAGHRLRPGSLIVSNHLRDSDVPLLTATLGRRSGLRIREPLPFFAAREDLFEPDALAGLLRHWPRPLPALLGSIPLGWLLGNMRALPMRRLREFTLGETIRELVAAGFGAADPAAVFNASGQRAIGAGLGRLPREVADIDVRALGPARHDHWGLRRLRPGALRRLAPRLRATVAAQLDDFGMLLDEGHSVYFAPEGVLSRDGAFGRVRDGVRRLCGRADRPAWLLPSALSYDPLGPGRLRVIVHVGPALHDLDPANPRRFAADLRRALVALCAVTPSHLVAGFLCAGPARFTTLELAEWLRRATAQVGAAGLTLDPLLERTDPDALARQRLRWLTRRKLVARDGSQWRGLLPADVKPGWDTPASQVRYLANALAEICPALIRTPWP